MYTVPSLDHFLKSMVCQVLWKFYFIFNNEKKLCFLIEKSEQINPSKIPIFA